MASENLCGLREHLNHLVQLTAAVCRRKTAVIWHCTAIQQQSREGRGGDSSRCQKNFRWEECNYPNRNRSWAFIFGKGVQFLYLEAEIFPCSDSHTAFTTTSDSELFFFRPKMDPTIFSRCTLLSFFKAQLHQEAFETYPCFLFYRWLSTSAHRTRQIQPPRPSLSPKKP